MDEKPETEKSILVEALEAVIKNGVSPKLVIADIVGSKFENSDPEGKRETEKILLAALRTTDENLRRIIICFLHKNLAVLEEDTKIRLSRENIPECCL